MEVCVEGASQPQKQLWCGNGGPGGETHSTGLLMHPRVGNESRAISDFSLAKKQSCICCCLSRILPQIKHNINSSVPLHLSANGTCSLRWCLPCTTGVGINPALVPFQGNSLSRAEPGRTLHHQSTSSPPQFWSQFRVQGNEILSVS